MGLFWDRFEIALELVCDCFGVVLELFWDCLGIVSKSSWDRSGIVLGSFLDRFGIVLGSFWVRFGFVLNSFCDRFGFGRARQAFKNSFGDLKNEMFAHMRHFLLGGMVIIKSARPITLCLSSDLGPDLAS